MQLSVRLVQLWNEWEIRLLVLLSFTLQLFLFFTGGLRRRSINKLLRFSIWLAYLGADMIAFYTLGQISRLGDSIHMRDPFTGTKSLAFFWAPFLLVHLGGQDTITAFSSEDNNLWLRHFLNLLVEVSLAFYVVWKSMGQSNQLLVPAMFVFVSGIIKYGERIWALKYGSKSDLNSTTTNYENNQLPPLSVEKDRYADMVCYALHTARYIRGFLAGRATFQMGHEFWFTLVVYFGRFADHESRVKIIEMELALIYDDLYTKAVVFRAWTGSIFRCLVQISTVVAFVLFHANKKEIYSGVDVAITYALLTGSIFMELVSVLMAMVSPWTWAFLKARNFRWLTYMSWSIFNYVQPEKSLWWSNSMGQYNLLHFIISDGSPTIVIIGNIMKCIRLDKLWRTLWHTKHVSSKKIMACVVQWLDEPDRFKGLACGMSPRLGTELEMILRGPFEHAILQLHLFTDYHIRGLSNDERSRLSRIKDETSDIVNICEDHIRGLSNDERSHLSSTEDVTSDIVNICEDHIGGLSNDERSRLSSTEDKTSSSTEDKTSDIVNICEEISNYMLYLLVENPSMLPVSTTTEDMLALFPKKVFSTSKEHIRDVLHKDWRAGEIEGKILLGARALLDYPQSKLPIDVLMREIKEIWIRLLVYAAGKSQADAHAQQMSKGGGELLTFVWLLMGAHYELGDVARRLDLISSSSRTGEGDRLFAFCFPPDEQPSSV